MNKKIRYNLIGAALALVLIGLDQWTKVLAVKHLMGQEPMVIWNGVFELHYLENRGAAFGILQGQKVVFLICFQQWTFLLFGNHRSDISHTMNAGKEKDKDDKI